LVSLKAISRYTVPGMGLSRREGSRRKSELAVQGRWRCMRKEWCRGGRSRSRGAAGSSIAALREAAAQAAAAEGQPDVRGASFANPGLPSCNPTQPLALRPRWQQQAAASGAYIPGQVRSSPRRIPGSRGLTRASAHTRGQARRTASSCAPPTLRTFSNHFMALHVPGRGRFRRESRRARPPNGRVSRSAGPPDEEASTTRLFGSRPIAPARAAPPSAGMSGLSVREAICTQCDARNTQ